MNLAIEELTAAVEVEVWKQHQQAVALAALEMISFSSPL
jgi:hypothetical protein